MGTLRTRPATRRQHVLEKCSEMSLPYFVRLGLVASPHKRGREVMKKMLKIKETKLIVTSEGYLFLERFPRMCC